MSWFLQQLTLPSGRRKRLDGQRLEDSLITQTAQVMQFAPEDAPFELAHHDVAVQVAPEAARSLHNAVWRLSLAQRPTSALVAVAMRSRQGDRLWRWLVETLDDDQIGYADASDRPRAPWLVIVPHAPDDTENGPARIPHLESLAQRIAWAWATRIYKQDSH